jgi:hypothetical protein
MRVAKKDKTFTYLELESGEQLDDLVEAFARASFETAKPVGISSFRYEANDRWEDVRHEVREFNPRARPSESLLAMDYVAGRRCKTQLILGRKYVKFYPGEGREEDTTTVLALAAKYMHQAQAEREVENEIRKSRSLGGGLARAIKQFEAWQRKKTPVLMIIQGPYFVLSFPGFFAERSGESFMFQCVGQSAFSPVFPSSFETVEVEEDKGQRAILMEKFQAGKWQGRLQFLEIPKGKPMKLSNIVPMPSSAIH